MDAATLPVDVLRRILAVLSFTDAIRASQVCRHWRACSAAFAGTADLSDLHLRQAATPAALSRGLRSVAQRFPLLRGVHFCCVGAPWLRFADVDVKFCAQHCKHLREIMVCGPCINAVAAIAACIRVEEVSLYAQAPAPAPVDEIAGSAPPTLRALSVECTPNAAVLPITLSAVWTLSNLKVLRLPGNALGHVAVGALFNLEVLDLSWNFITELPPDIANLRNLQVLCVSENRLTDIPNELCDLPRLEKLDVSYNYLLSLPPALATMKALLVLDARHNMFFPSRIPAVVLQLPALIIEESTFI